MCTKAVLKRTPLHIHTCTHIPPPPSGAGIRGWLPLETELLEDKSPRLNCLLVPSTVPGPLVIHSFVFTMHTVGVLVESVSVLQRSSLASFFKVPHKSDTIHLSLSDLLHSV